VFWVISVYFNIRNTLPKSGTFLLGHPVYVIFHTYVIYDIYVIYHTYVRRAIIMHTFYINVSINYNVFDMFRTSKCPSSGRLVHVVVWYFCHASI